MLVYTKYAKKDAKRLASAGLKSKAQGLLKILERSPYESPGRIRQAQPLREELGPYSSRLLDTKSHG